MAGDDMEVEEPMSEGEDSGHEARLSDAFRKGLDLPADADVARLAFGSHPHWDSLGHMSLVTTIEEAFGIALDGSDIDHLDTYQSAVAILQGKGVFAP
jgi:acyl carrier protein